MIDKSQADRDDLIQRGASLEWNGMKMKMNYYKNENENKNGGMKKRTHFALRASVDRQEGTTWNNATGTMARTTSSKK